MDATLIPLMILLTVILLPAVGYPFYAFWRARRNVAWNVVNAALVMRTAGPDLRQALEAEVQSLLPAHRMTRESFAHAPPEVRLAMYALAMQGRGIQPPGPARRFYPLSSPHLARSAQKHIRYVRFLVESEQALRLEVLDERSTPT